MPTPEQNAFLLAAFGVNVGAVASNTASTPGQNANASAPQTAGGSGTVGDTQKDPNEPVLTPDQRLVAINVDMPAYRAAYDAALQGTSGKFTDAQKATELAQSIAEEAVSTASSRVADLTQEQRDALIDVYNKFFLEAVQGLSSGNDTPNATVLKAHAMALRSMNVQGKEVERLEWRQATLPQPVAPDCEIVHGKVPGPKNFVLCKTHGHVIDTDQQMVIAHTVDEFKASLN